MNICEKSYEYFHNFAYLNFNGQGDHSIYKILRIEELIDEDFTHLLC